MNLVQAVVLGLLQGFTEFLPVSSSGHLVLAESLLGVNLPGVLFEVTLHVATVGAVLWVYRRRVVRLAVGLVTGDRRSLAYLLLLAIGSVPAAAAGLLGRGFFERAFDEPVLVAILLVATGCLVFSLKWSGPLAEAAYPGAAVSLGVGVAQAAAILPGLSRSGATVAIGAWLGVELRSIAEFSFLLSVPAIGGAALLQVWTPEVVASGLVSGAQAGTLGTAALGAGFAAALLSGVLAIRIFLRMLSAHTFHRFAYYCWGVGLVYLVAAAFLPELRG